MNKVMGVVVAAMFALGSMAAQAEDQMAKDGMQKDAMHKDEMKK